LPAPIRAASGVPFAAYLATISPDARGGDRDLGFKEKVANSIDTLRQAFPRSAAIDMAMDKLAAELALLKQAPPATISQLMGVEGRVGYAYFNAWRTCPLKWKGTDRYPIPDDWYCIGRRSSKLGTQSAGLDPTIGIFHGKARGQLGLVYDLMEPLRPIVDRAVLKFLQTETFHPADFSITSDGVRRLNPEMAKCVARMVAPALEAVTAWNS
jgi:CRISPR-associated protein Cas1